MKRHLMIAVSVCGFAGATTGSSQEGGRQQARMILEALDTDHDGTLSAAEIKMAPQSLAKLDHNADGQLTIDELSPRPENAGAPPDELVKQLMSFDRSGKGYLIPGDVPERMQGLFQRADTNHDGKLTPDEMRTLSTRQGMPAGAQAQPGRASGIFRMDPLVNALDINHDGVISAEEIAAATSSLLMLDRNADGNLTPDEMRVRQQTPEDRANHMLDEWDTNKDGKLARAEAPERMAAQFDAMDKNKDGFLDKDELIEYFKTQGSQPRNGGPREGSKGAPPTD
jgi:Ca2+-binding EF-hand superfamily protein